MEQFVDFASSLQRSVGPALEELVCENGKILARGLSANPSSFQSARAQTAKHHGDILTTKRPTLGTVDGVVRDFCLPSFQDGMEPTKHYLSLHDDHRDTRFGLFFEDTEDIAHDKHVREPQVVPVYEDGIRARNIDESDKFSIETFADPFDKQILKDGETPLLRSGLTNSKFQMVNSRSGKHLKLQNFSLFPRPEALNNFSGAAKPTSSPRSLPLEQSKSNYVKPPEGGGNLLVLPSMGEGSHSLECLQGFQNRLDPTAGTLEAIRPIAKPPELSPTPDEQSEALFHKCSAKREYWPDQAPGFASGLPANTIKEEPNAGKLVGQDFATTSTCSRGASNDVEALRCRHEYLACPSENVKDEQVEKIKQVPAQGSAGSKRKTKQSHKLTEKRRHNKINKKMCELQKLIPNCSKRKTKQGHKLTEKRRHNKINKKMRELQKLIPNCSKVDKASILDEAIQYLIALQLQVQMMSMGIGICMPPIMFPTEKQRLQAPHLSLFPRMNVGFGYNTPPPFSTSAILGLHGQVLQTSMSGAPLVPSNGGHSA